MIIRCPICQTELSNDLHFTHENYEYFGEAWSDDCFDYECSTAVRKGTWTITQHNKPLAKKELGMNAYEVEKTFMAIHIKDSKNLVLDMNKTAAQGCCDAGGFDGLNMRCSNCKTLIARVEKDCWQPKQMVFELGEYSKYLELVPKNSYEYEFAFDPETIQDFPVYDFSKKFSHDELSKQCPYYLTKRSNMIDDQIVSAINTGTKKGIDVIFSGQDLFVLVKQGVTLLGKVDLKTTREYLKGLEDTFEIKESVFWHTPASETNDICGVYFDGKEYPSDQLLLDSFKREDNIHNRVIDFEGFISEDGYELIKKDLAPFLLGGAFCTDEPLKSEEVEKITKLLKRRIELLQTHEFDSNRATGYWFNHPDFYQNYRPVIIELLQFTIKLLNKIVQEEGQVHINWI